MDQKSSVEKMHHYCGGDIEKRKRKRSYGIALCRIYVDKFNWNWRSSYEEWCISDLGMKEKLGEGSPRSGGRFEKAKQVEAILQHSRPIGILFA